MDVVIFLQITCAIAAGGQPDRDSGLVDLGASLGSRRHC